METDKTGSTQWQREAKFVAEIFTANSLVLSDCDKMQNFKLGRKPANLVSVS